MILINKKLNAKNWDELKNEMYSKKWYIETIMIGYTQLHTRLTDFENHLNYYQDDYKIELKSRYSIKNFIVWIINIQFDNQNQEIRIIWGKSNKNE